MKKKISKYNVVFERDAEGGFVVTVPKLPGCISQGDTFEEAQRMIEDAIKGYIKVLKKHGDWVPQENDQVIMAPVFVAI